MPPRRSRPLPPRANTRTRAIAANRVRRQSELDARRARYQARNDIRLPQAQVDDAPFRVDVSGAMGNAVRTARFVPQRVFHHGPRDYFDRLEPYFDGLLRHQFGDGTAFKASLEVNGTFARMAADGEQDQEVPMTTSQYTVETRADIRGVFALCVQDITDQVDAFQQNGSNWIIRAIGDAVLRLSEYSRHDRVEGHGMRFLPGGASYLELPKWIKNKHACINIQNEDDYCFKYAMAAAYCDRQNCLPTNNMQRASHYQQYLHLFNTSGMEFPFHVNQLAQFEKQNAEHKLAFRVLVADPSDRYFTIAYATKNAPPESWFVVLLMYGTANYENSHYVYVHRPDTLLSPEDATNHHKKLHCLNCLKGFWTKKSLDKHTTDFKCENNSVCKTRFPFGDKAYYTFKKYSACLKTDWIVYADFECILVDTNDPKNPRRTQTHVPCGFTSVLICTFNPSLSKYDLPYTATNMEQSDRVGAELIRRLDEYRLYVETIEATHTHVIDMTLADAIAHKQATRCYICNGPFEKFRIRGWKDEHVEQNVRKVADHDHRKPWLNYRGAAHSFCNLQAKGLMRKRTWGEEEQEEEEESDDDDGDEDMGNPDEKKWVKNDFNNRIPVVFHNFKGYDSHIIIRSLKDSLVRGDVSVIPQQGEKSLSLSFNGFQFIDSLAFLQNSLDSLTNLLTQKGNDLSGLRHTRVAFENVIAPWLDLLPTEERFRRIAQKGIYPYDYMNSFDRFEEKKLPDRESFYSKLTEQETSQDEHDHAKTVFDTFELTSLRQYHDLYLMQDVLLLADIFENFRETTFQDIGLDPARFVSLPGLSRDSGLFFHDNVIDAEGIERPFEVELFRDCEAHKDMYEFCENAIRGGVSMIKGRYSKAGNGKVIIYLDANNLYGWAMSQWLPVGDYKWLAGWELVLLMNEDIWKSMPDDGEFGYFLEVDMDIPTDIHDKLKDLPIAPVKQCVDMNDLSPFSMAQYAAMGTQPDCTNPKLLLTLYNKEKYSLHFRTLKLYLQLGAELKKVHRILRFRQERWIKPFIDYHTAKRTEASKEKNEFKKNYHKLIANSFYGKTIEDTRKHQKVDIVTNRHRQLKLARDPFYTGFKEIHNECLVVSRRKKEVELDKPKLVGACILEMAKLRMYDFFYNTMRSVFGDRMRLLMTDTDSLVMEIETDDWQQEIRAAGRLSEMDFSAYPIDHPFIRSLSADERKLVMETNNSAIGKMKDELSGVLPEEFVGLRSKMYSLKMPAGHDDVKKAKGVKHHVVKNGLSFDEYYECLTQEGYRPESRRVLGFASHDQQTYTEFIDKTTLSAADTKLYLVDAVTTLPHGHYLIQEGRTHEALTVHT